MLSTTKDVVFYALPHIKGRVLDLGAGMAKYKPILIRSATSYTTCDVQKGQNIDVICDVMNLIFPTESFDTVVSTQVFEHIPNPFLVAREIKKVLKPGGIALVTAPFMIPFHPDPQDNFRFSNQGLREIFESENFEIIDSGVYGGFFMVLSEMIHFSWFNPYKRKSARLMSLVEKIAKIFDKIAPAKIIYANSFVVAKKLTCQNF